jgi:hypothetical protein
MLAKVKKTGLALTCKTTIKFFFQKIQKELTREKMCFTFCKIQTAFGLFQEGLIADGSA